MPESGLEPPPARLHILIAGFVQGVGFRAYVQSMAAEMTLTGWVRNTGEGEVEVLAEGPQNELVVLLSQLQRGPRAARVVSLNHTWEKPTGEFNRFSLKPTHYG
jgi:acylphosphatase